MKSRQAGKRKNIPHRDGFSLVEVMMVIMLVGILAGVAAPPMFNYLESNRMKTRTDRMVADLQYARAVSIASGQTLRFASTTNSYTLTNTVTGEELRNIQFNHGAELAMNQAADFFPWGMATTTVFDLSLHGMERTVTLLPTGMVEVDIP
ncbi:MAG: prepilin-type N-terminal cleavage/methylation domain-containing protein [bacterium]|nr:prepilin-type N-terminal cleavage/methylation domain-containing protein [bacterium]